MSVSSGSDILRSEDTDFTEEIRERQIPLLTMEGGAQGAEGQRTPVRRVPPQMQGTPGTPEPVIERRLGEPGDPIYDEAFKNVAEANQIASAAPRSLRGYIEK